MRESAHDDPEAVERDTTGFQFASLPMFRRLIIRPGSLDASISPEVPACTNRICEPITRITPLARMIRYDANGSIRPNVPVFRPGVVKRPA